MIPAPRRLKAWPRSLEQRRRQWRGFREPRDSRGSRRTCGSRATAVDLTISGFGWFELSKLEKYGQPPVVYDGLRLFRTPMSGPASAREPHGPPQTKTLKQPAPLQRLGQNFTT